MGEYGDGADDDCCEVHGDGAGAVADDAACGVAMVVDEMRYGTRMAMARVQRQWKLKLLVQVMLVLSNRWPG